MIAISGATSGVPVSKFVSVFLTEPVGDDGGSPPSFDKQIVRDHLETLDWNKTPPGPQLPDDVIARTGARYREAETRLTRA